MPDATTPAPRYALYYAPPVGSAAWQAGSAWLGRCAAQQPLPLLPSLDGIAPSVFQHLTAAPRRYGWHATLKAPFRLAEGATETQLLAALRDFCARHHAFVLPPLTVALLGDFLAWVPMLPSPALQALAADCVTQLHPLTAPLSEADLQRRRQARLSPREDALLVQWGYPHVLDCFQFHMSLTGSLAGVAAAVVDTLHAAAQDWLAPHSAGLCFDAVSLFVEPTPGADFTLLQQIPLTP